MRGSEEEFLIPQEAIENEGNNSVRGLPLKNKDTSSSPRTNPKKILSVEVFAYNSTVGQDKTGRSLGLPGKPA